MFLCLHICLCVACFELSSWADKKSFRIKTVPEYKQLLTDFTCTGLSIVFQVGGNFKKVGGYCRAKGGDIFLLEEGLWVA